MIPIISTQELKKLIDKKEKYVLIDVREKEELQHGMIPTAHNVPLSEFLDAMELDEISFHEKYDFPKPSKKDKLILHCRSGGRSHQACMIAKQKGYQVTNYEGSTWAWAEIDKNVKRYGPEP